jgi:hypothetical protein
VCVLGHERSECAPLFLGDGDHQGVTTAIPATTPPPDPEPRPDSPADPQHDLGNQVTDRLDSLVVGPAREAPEREAPEREAPEKEAPEKDAPEGDAPEGDDHPLTGRHRAAPSPARRAVRTAAWGLACLLIAVLLGWGAAVMMGLTGPTDLASGAAGAFPVQKVDPADRTFERTVEVTGKPPRSDEIPTSAPGTTADPAPASEPATSPARPSSPAPSVVPTPTRVPTVAAGDPCSTVGAAGVTEDGRAAVCTAGPGNSKSRWRHA